MKASFRALGNGSADQGNYSEIWVSREQWRREVEFGSFRRVEVGGPKKNWLLDSGKVIPGTAPVLSTLSLGSMPKELKVKQVLDKDLGGVLARCVHSETELGQEVFCIDRKDETLLIHESLSRSSPRSHFSYVYRNYEKFGDHLFPRSVQYKSEGQAGLEINISELNREDSPSSPDFAAVSGALETTNCLPAEMTPPRTRSAPDPDFPRRARTDKALVILWMIIGVDGRAHDIQVVRTGGDVFDTEAVRTIGRWRFEAPKCRGESVAAPINVEVNFQR
jgi:TonB family protein